MMSLLDNTNPVELGERLRNARVSAGMSQEQAAQLIDAARTTMVAIEKGQRRVKAEELVRLADAYKIPCNELLRPAPVGADLVPQFRMTLSGHELQDAAMEAARHLQRLSTSYVEVERLMNRPSRLRHFDRYLPSKGESIEEQAEDYAMRIRSESNLGLNPIPDMVQLLEDWGFRVFVRPLDSRIAGVYAFHPEMGPCILLNRKHPRVRNNSTCAHEFGHDRIDRDAPGVVWTADRPQRGHSERFAWAFGQAFLMPRSALRQAHAELQEQEGPLKVSGLVYLAYRFRVSVEAMARRLENLGLVRSGTASRVAEKGVEVPGDLVAPTHEEYPVLPARLGYLLSYCESQGVLSEGQMASMFMVERSELRSLLDRFSGAYSE